jgi:hypothetical protein
MAESRRRPYGCASMAPFGDLSKGGERYFA